MRPPRLIVMEFNELCPSLLDEYMGRGALPNFRRLYDESTVFVTDAGEQASRLEPWIQWPTVHSGMTYAEHRVLHLGDGRKLDRKCLAELLSDAGVPVGVCGSMNLNYRSLNGYLLPDPWDKEGRASPERLAPYYRIVANQVQESSRADGLSKMDMLAFAWFLAWNGLTFGTAQALARQLIQERRDPGVRWRRAMLLDRIQYDVFRRLNRRHAVRFATFFCNSTAHFQHYHWRNMQPERFAAPPPATDHASLRDAIPEGYQAMDRLVGRFLCDYPDAVLVLCTALSQQAWTDTTKCTFRPKRFEALLEFAHAAADAGAVKPVMAEQFHVECRDDEAASRTETRLRELTIDEQPVMTVKRQGRSVFAGCRIFDTALMDREVRGRDGGRRFGDLFYMIHTMRSGRHHPDGALWFRNGRHEVIREKAPLIDVAPTVLAHFKLEPPEYMRGRPLPV